MFEKYFFRNCFLKSIVCIFLWFFLKVSGLTKHHGFSDKPLKYSHFDVAGSSGDLPEPTTGSTVVAFSMHFLQ